MKQKTILKYMLIVVLILIFLPLSVYFILITPSRFGIIDRSDVGAWMGYYGAVLGGAITLAGVWVTIKQQEKSSKQDQAIQYKPILDITKFFTSTNGVSYREVGLGVTGHSTRVGESNDFQLPHYFSFNQDNKITFSLTITNKGRGETSNARIRTFSPVYDQIDWTDNTELHSTTTDVYIGELLAGQDFEIRILLPPYLIIKKEIIQEKEEVDLNTIIEIQYNDMFDEIKYQYNIHIRFKVLLNKNDFEEVSRESSAIRVSYSLDQIMPDRRLAKDNV